MKQIGHQGDTQWFSISRISKKAKLIEKKFIAASERSGSFHALSGSYQMFEVEGGFEIEVLDDCILNHSLQSELNKIKSDLSVPVELPKKDHRAAKIKKGFYFVGIQNRFDPMENLKKKVID